MTVSFPCFFQGAGTAAHLMLKFWPWLQLIGWEIDPMVTTLLIGHFCSVFLLITLLKVFYNFTNFNHVNDICYRLVSCHKNISNLSLVMLNLSCRLIYCASCTWFFMYPIFIGKADCVSWQIIELSRDYFGMSDLEKATESGGSLSVHIGDALSPSATVQGGFAGE